MLKEVEGKQKANFENSFIKELEVLKENLLTEVLEESEPFNQKQSQKIATTIESQNRRHISIIEVEVTNTHTY